MSPGPWALEVWTPSQGPTASPHHVWALTPPGFPAHHVPSTLVLRHQTALSPKASAQASPLGLGMGVGGRHLQLPCGLKFPPCLHRTFSGFPDKPGPLTTRASASPSAAPWLPLQGPGLNRVTSLRTQETLPISCLNTHQMCFQRQLCAALTTQ